MSHTFAIDLPAGTNLGQTLDKVRKAIKEAGGSFEFDATTGRGTFTVKGVAGSFVTTRNQVLITITKKPFIVSNGFIEKGVRDYFST
jgi:hypothetical protein